MFLHAEELAFRHPVHENRLRLRAPLATDLYQFLLRLPDVEATELQALLRGNTPGRATT